MTGPAPAGVPDEVVAAIAAGYCMPDGDSTPTERSVSEVRDMLGAAERLGWTLVRGQARTALTVDDVARLVHAAWVAWAARAALRQEGGEAADPAEMWPWELLSESERDLCRRVGGAVRALVAARFARLAYRVLEAHRIRPRFLLGLPAGQVRRQELIRSRAVLQVLDQVEAELPHDMDDDEVPYCPKCGFFEVQGICEDDGFEHYQCQGCGHCWDETGTYLDGSEATTGGQE